MRKAPLAHLVSAPKPARTVDHRGRVDLADTTNQPRVKPLATQGWSTFQQNSFPGWVLRPPSWKEAAQ
jgi:hypothetical protein